MDYGESGDEEVSFFVEEQIAYALGQLEMGMGIGEVFREAFIAEATFYVWRKK